MNKGVIYYNTGLGCLTRLLVSIYSLRQHYDGPIAILSEGEDSKYYCKQIAEDLNCYVKDVKIDIPDGSQEAFIKKTLLYKHSPYFLSIFLDADTIVKGDITPLFEWATMHGFVATQFNNWTSKSKVIVDRINAWNKIYPNRMEKAYEYGPAINAGCYAFRRDAKFLADWYSLTLPGRDIELPEETIMQLFLMDYPHYIAPQEYNCSCRYSNPRAKDVKVIHYHGKKHCSHDFCGDIWLDNYSKVKDANLGGVSDWGVRFDEGLTRYNYGFPTDPYSPRMHGVTIGYKCNDLTVVTYASPTSVSYLADNYRTWKAKPQIADLPLIIYYNNVDESQLKFAKNARLIKWNGLMYNAMVYGVAKDVTTGYWLKLNQDVVFHDRSDLFTEESFKYEIFGLKYNATDHGNIAKLDEWGTSLPGSNILTPQQRLDIAEVPYKYERVSPWLCLYKSRFVKMAASLTPTLPIPSDDTYLWYVAHRLGLPWGWSKYRLGVARAKDKVGEALAKLHTLYGFTET